MNKITKLTKNWLFCLDTSLKFNMPNENSHWSDIDLPHDWQISHVNNLYEDSIGFYKKILNISPQNKTRYVLYFEGVYMNSTLFVNNQKVGDWKYGYSSFYYDITDFLKNGDNEILLKVSVKHPNSRWYSGAGVYRDVYLWEMPEKHLIPQSLYISTKENENWTVNVSAEVGSSYQTNFDCYKLKFDLIDNNNIIDTKFVAISNGDTATDYFGNLKTVIKCKTEFIVNNPHLWDLDDPYRYKIEVSLIKDNTIKDSISSKFGFRTVRFTANNGMYLNHKKVLIHGVCMHHDLGCLGAAFNYSAAKRQLEIMKNMGANAIRTAHNMPSEGVLEIADELGILVVDEAFDMWRSTKTDYDYGNFFDEWYKKDVASWVRRDRNHPSVIMWSIGNEIYDTHSSEEGAKTMQNLMNEVLLHDENSNAALTLGSNYMPWENTQKCADIIKLIGYNYGERYYKDHHEKHPDWIIYGSETASIVQSRGIYHFPLSESLLVDDDMQCSSLGNSRTSWGAKSVDACINADKENPFSLGQFIWSGFDYIGEPTPYHTKNSYFGQVDTAGFEKDSFYQYKAGWTNKPMVHLLPYWDFNEGQIIDVCAYSNAYAVELIVNDKSQGKKTINKQQSCMVCWQVPYKKGYIKAIAYDENGNEVAEEIKHSFGDAVKLKLTANKTKFDKDELAFITVTALDKDGFEVENANNYINIDICGYAQLLGLDNGDSTDFTEYKTNSKQLFSGKLLAVVSGKGKTTITASSSGLESASFELDLNCEEVLSDIIKTDNNSYIPVRKIELAAQNTVLTPDNSQTEVIAKIYPENADISTLDWLVTNDGGVTVNEAEIEILSDNKVLVKGLGDGKVRVRCTCNNNRNHAVIISQLEFTIKKMGKLSPNPYEFLSGSLYNKFYGEIGNGNERGVSMSRTGMSWVSYENLDFGKDGSNTVKIPIFELAGEPTPIRFWRGVPYAKGSKMIGERIYFKPKMWNVYQDEVFTLDERLTGIQTFSIELNHKIHIKGFEFEKQSRAFDKIKAIDNDMIYGDTYSIEQNKVTGIGNNVSLVFKAFDFGENGAKAIKICGNTPLDKNTIHICFNKNGEEFRQLVDFTGDKNEQIFNLDTITGLNDVTFLFLPGCQFDFESFEFLK